VTVLLDANVPIALVVDDHVHHGAAEAWLAGVESFATCPITQGSLVRLLVCEGRSAASAVALVAELSAERRHTFWPDDVAYPEVIVAGVIGHRQVTDAYLAQLARRREARLASFDPGLAAAHPDVVTLVPTR
jgi:hypothetical protein